MIRISEYRPPLLLNAVMAVTAVVLMLLRPVDHIRDYVIERPVEAGINHIEVYEDVNVSQRFKPNREADSLELYLQVPKDDYYGNFSVEIFDGEGLQVGNWIRSKLDISEAKKEDGGWTALRLGNARLKKDGEYSVVVSAPDLKEGSGVYVFFNSEETLLFSVYRDLGNPFAAVAIILSFLMANLWWFLRDRRFEVRAAVVLIGTGLIMLLIMAPGSQPDEDQHYYTSFKLSNLIMGNENLDEMEEEYYIQMDYKNRSFMGTDCHDLTVHWNSNSSFLKLLTKFWEPPAYREGTRTCPGDTFSIDQPSSYLAQAFGLTLGRLLNGNYLQVYTLGRIFNLLFYIIMVLVAIRLIPSNKELMLLIGAIPMAIHQAASLSYDVIINGLSLVFFAFILRIAQDGKPFTWKETLEAAFILFLFGPVKVIYFVFWIFVLIIPEGQFKDWIDGSLKFVLVPVMAVLTAFLSQLPKVKILVSGKTFGPHIHLYNVGYVIDHPIRCLRLFFDTIANDFVILMGESVGYRLAGLQITITEIFFVAYIALLLAGALYHKDEIRILDKWNRMLIFGTVLLGIGFMLAIFSFAMTTYGRDLVYGLQGRYLIPFVAPVLYCISPMKTCPDFDEKTLMIPFFVIWLCYIFEIASRVAYGM